MKNKTLKIIAEEYPELQYPTGFEDAVIGLVERFGMNPVILLDREKIIKTLIKRDKMSREEAINTTIII